MARAAATSPAPPAHAPARAATAVLGALLGTLFRAWPARLGSAFALAAALPGPAHANEASRTPIELAPSAAERKAVRGSWAPEEFSTWEVRELDGFERTAFTRANLAKIRVTPSDADGVLPPGFLGRWKGTGDDAPAEGAASAEVSAPATVTDPDLEMRWDAEVGKYVEYLTRDPKGRTVMASLLRRKSRYEPAIVATLQQQGAPRDLIYVALVESALDPRAQWNDGTAGPWRLTVEAARGQNLEVGFWVDGRREPELATAAAARRFKELQVRFGSWPLALAAYRVGPEVMLELVSRLQTNDYDELRDRRDGLPREALLFVARVLGAALVGRNAAAFGFTDVAQDPAEVYEKVPARPGTTFATLARAAVVGVETLRDLNPELVRDRTPPDRGPYDLRVPPGSAKLVTRGLNDELTQADEVITHFLRVGESLDDLAARFGIAGRELRKLNGVRDASELRGGVTILMPTKASSRTSRAAPASAEAPMLVAVPDRAFSYPDRERVFYRVCDGDTVDDLAAIFKVPGPGDRRLEQPRRHRAAAGGDDPAALRGPRHRPLGAGAAGFRGAAGGEHRLRGVPRDGGRPARQDPAELQRKGGRHPQQDRPPLRAGRPRPGPHQPHLLEHRAQRRAEGDPLLVAGGPARVLGGADAVAAEAAGPGRGRGPQGGGRRQPHHPGQGRTRSHHADACAQQPHGDDGAQGGGRRQPRPHRGSRAPGAGAALTVPELMVDPAEAGLRLDVFLARRGLFPSAAASRRFLAEPATRVRIDGRPARKGEHLAPGQRVQLPEPPAPAGAAIAPDDSLPLEVLHADEALVAVAKPAGLPSHPLRAGERGTVASALVARFPECAVASPDPREAGLVHRLDTGTSGVLVASRQRALWTPLHEALGEGGDKLYLAEVAGACSATVIDAAIGRVGRRGDRVRVGTGRGLLPARTEVTVVVARAETTLVNARLHRGRAHQVRAHLAHAGHPVLGDPLYGDEAAKALAARLGVEGLRLHAASVTFVHPLTAEWLTIAAPPPAWAVG